MESCGLLFINFFRTNLGLNQDWKLKGQIYIINTSNAYQLLTSCFSPGKESGMSDPNGCPSNKVNSIYFLNIPYTDIICLFEFSADNWIFFLRFGPTQASMWTNAVQNNRGEEEGGGVRVEW